MTSELALRNDLMAYCVAIVRIDWGFFLHSVFFPGEMHVVTYSCPVVTKVPRSLARLPAGVCSSPAGKMVPCEEE